MTRIKKETQNQIADLLLCKTRKQTEGYLKSLSPSARIDIYVALLKQRIKKPKRIK
jgi:hypothetical protein